MLKERLIVLLYYGNSAIEVSKVKQLGRSELLVHRVLWRRSRQAHSGSSTAVLRQEFGAVAMSAACQLKANLRRNL